MSKVSTEFEKSIKMYLDALANDDEFFAAMYAREGKSIEQCCDYILTEVKKSGKIGFHDNEIYGLAVHYYEEDTDKLGTIGHVDQGKIVVNHVVELSEEEKENARKAAVKAYQEKCIEMMINKNKKPVAKKEEDAQLSLF